MGISLVIVKTDEKIEGGKKVSPLYLQYKFKGTYKRFPTHQYIETKFWKGGVISNRCPNYHQINRRIISIRSKIEKVITEIIELNGIPTPILVKKNFDELKVVQIKKQPKPKKRFWVSYEQFLEDKKKHHRGYTKTLYTLRNTLEKFEMDTKNSLTFDYINLGRFETDFKNYCLDIELPKKKGSKEIIKGLSNNYVNKVLSNLKIFLSWCKSERIIDEVKKFKILKIVRNDVLVYLNTEEVKKMFDYKDFDYPKVYDDLILIKDMDKNGNIIYWNNLELIKDIFVNRQQKVDKI